MEARGSTVQPPESAVSYTTSRSQGSTGQLLITDHHESSMLRCATATVPPGPISAYAPFREGVSVPAGSDCIADQAPRTSLIGTENLNCSYGEQLLTKKQIMGEKQTAPSRSCAYMGFMGIRPYSPLRVCHQIHGCIFCVIYHSRTLYLLFINCLQPFIYCLLFIYKKSVNVK